MNIKIPKARGVIKIVALVFLFAVVAVAVIFFYRALRYRGGENLAQVGGNRIFENSDGGYSLTIPADWRIENIGSTSVALYPVYASSLATHCKLEISSFPGMEESARDAWIGSRLGTGPAIDVAEGSSEQVSVGGMPAVRWAGVMDGAFAVRVYAFAPTHAYEFIPDDVAACESSLNIVIGGIRFFPEQQRASNDGHKGLAGVARAIPAVPPSAAAPSSSSALSASSASNSGEEDCL